jgi:D-aminoacyl-tRNA deacylase
VRALLQRVARAAVHVEGRAIASIDGGLVVLIGVGQADAEATAVALAKRVTELRIFADEAGRTNRSLVDVAGSALVVSQFTLYADTSHGRRPGFTDAAAPEVAERLYRRFAAALEDRAWATSRPGRSVRRCRSSSSTMARSRSGSRPIADVSQRREMSLAGQVRWARQTDSSPRAKA